MCVSKVSCVHYFRPVARIVCRHCTFTQNRKHRRARVSEPKPCYQFTCERSGSVFWAWIRETRVMITISWYGKWLCSGSDSVNDQGFSSLCQQVFITLNIHTNIRRKWHQTLGLEIGLVLSRHLWLCHSLSMVLDHAQVDESRRGFFFHRISGLNFNKTRAIWW